MILPERTRTQEGELRRIGFEFEYAGLSPRESAEVVNELFSGQVVQENAFSYLVEGTEFGDFRVELDIELLRDKKYEGILENVGVDVRDILDPDKLERFLLSAASRVVPCEVVTPPIPMPRADAAEILRKGLRDRLAKGTGASLVYAFGLHFNMELPDLSRKTILAYLQSFLLLYPWLKAMSEVDVTRRATFFIDPFPSSYVRKVLSLDYDPEGVEGLIRDYLEDNPTRNRALDMLPLFTFLNRELVLSHDVEKELIKPRPTPHYRLPNCRIDDPSWSVGREWELWLEVERLANIPADREELISLFQKTPGFPLVLFRDSWKERLGKWIETKGRNPSSA